MLLICIVIYRLLYYIVYIDNNDINISIFLYTSWCPGIYLYCKKCGTKMDGFDESEEEGGDCCFSGEQG